MKTRRLEPGELVIDALQRTSPMTFTMVARLTGPLDATRLERGLRRLERRHPMLRARVVRNAGLVGFEFGSAEPIPLHCERVPDDAWLPLTERLLTQRWTGAGPRAIVTWLQHDDDRSTLLFTGDHLTADATSAMLAVRDLLRFAHSDDDHVAERPAPGQSVLLPADLASLKNRLRGFRYILSGALAGQSDRPRLPGPFPIEGRTARLQVFTLERAMSERLAERVRRDRCTIHGVIGAAFATAIAQACGRDMRQRIMHPVDLRHYAKQPSPAARELGDAYGYYVSATETDHHVTRSAALEPLARGISEAVRRKKASGEPLISGPVAGGVLTKVAALMRPQRFCDLAENSLFRAAFALSHVGRIEAMGIEHDVGPVHIDALFGTTLSSLSTPLTVGGMLWAERVTVTMSSLEPLVPFELAQEIVRRGRQQLELYARAETQAPSLHVS